MRVLSVLSFPRWLGSLFRARAAPLEVVLYTRADCPLCVALKAELARARVRPAFRLREVDIARDPELEARHGLSIPVLEIDGRPAFKGRLTAGDFERKYARALAARAARAPGPSGHG